MLLSLTSLWLICFVFITKQPYFTILILRPLEKRRKPVQSLSEWLRRGVYCPSQRIELATTCFVMHIWVSHRLPSRLMAPIYQANLWDFRKWRTTILLTFKGKLVAPEKMHKRKCVRKNGTIFPWKIKRWITLPYVHCLQQFCTSSTLKSLIVWKLILAYFLVHLMYIQAFRSQKVSGFGFGLTKVLLPAAGAIFLMAFTYNTFKGHKR